MSTVKPFRRTARVGCVYVLAVGLICLLGSTYEQYLAGLVMIYAISTLGLDWLLGRAGQISIGNGALMAVGAYVTAVLSRTSWGLFPVPLLLSGLAAGSVGLLIALPSLRLRGIYFAFVTLALQFIAVFVAQTYETDSNQVAGAAVKAPTLGSITFHYGPSYTLMLGIVLGLTLLILDNMYRRLPGRMWLAIRENELAARTINVGVRRWKLTAFVGSSALIGVSGSLFAYYIGTVSSETFTLDFAILFVVMVIVGGLGSMGGAIFGAAFVTLIPQGLAQLSNQLSASSWLGINIPVINTGLYGAMVLLVLLYLPKGVVPSLLSAGSRIRSRSSHIARPNRSPSLQASQNGSARHVVDAGPRSTPVTETSPSLIAQRNPPGSLSTEGPALVVRDLTVVYRNGARALDGLRLDVDVGGVVALVGRNGAGKTTLLRSLTGFFPTERVRRSGSVMLAGHQIIGASPTEMSRLGVVLVPERDKVFPSLSVSDHLTHVGNADSAQATLPELWRFFQRRWKSPAGLLSGGERQLLALLVAASLRPRILLVDEMSLGLAPIMIKQVAEAIVLLRERSDTTLILVEQNVSVATAITDTVHYIENGRLIEPDGNDGAWSYGASLVHDGGTVNS